jgi:hypothetical protein
MREIFTSGSVGGAPGNRCFYPDIPTESPPSQKSFLSVRQNLNCTETIYFLPLLENMKVLRTNLTQIIQLTIGFLGNEIGCIFLPCVDQVG